MGEVYRARDTRLGREVALKVLPSEYSSDPQRLRYFEQEARSASALNHPNIITIYDIGQVDSTSYLAMELADGKTLREHLAVGPLPTKQLLQIAAQIADGLAKAHGAGIVHRDLKPENLMLTNEGLVKILDFGLAKLAQPEVVNEAGSQTATLAKATEPGVVLGTVGYMSPEQASGLPADFRSDQFALGTILYEMATGKRAFQRGTAVETLSAIIREEPEAVAAANPKAPAPVRWVVERCLAKSPDDRYASTRDLARELQSLRDHLAEIGGSEAAMLPVATPSARTRRFRTLATTVLAVGLLAAVAGVFFLGRSTHEPPPMFRQPTFRQLTFRLGNITGARFAPDGHTILYAAAWDGKPVDLFSTRPEGPESRSLGLPQAGIFSISSSGEMAIAMRCTTNWGECQGTLARVPLGGGAPREIMENVDYADWAADGKMLAVVRASEGRYRLEYPPGKVLYETPGWITHARVSPKGDLIAFLDHPIFGEIAGSVCVVDLTGKKKTLSTGWIGVKGLAWAPGGNEIWFTGTRVGRVLALYAITLSGLERLVLRVPDDLLLLDMSRDGRVLVAVGSPRTRMICLSPRTQKERDMYWFDWSTAADLSADGKTLLFYEWGEGVGGTPTVYLRKTDGSDAVRLGEGRALALSPDGKWALALQTTSPPQLILLPTGTGEQKPLPRGAIKEYYGAAWFPDGRRIFFAGEEPDHPPRSYVQGVDGGNPRPLTEEGMLAILVSPDGKLMLALGPDREYYLGRVDGGALVPIPGLEAGDVPLQWSADGRSLYVRGIGDFVAKVYWVGLSIRHRELWKELKPSDPAGLLGIQVEPGGVRLTPDGKSYVYTTWSILHKLFLVDGLK